MSRRYSREPRVRPGQRDDRLDRRAELVALRDEPALDALDLLLEPVDRRRAGAGRCRAAPRSSSASMRASRWSTTGYSASVSAVEHAVDDVILGLGALRTPASSCSSSSSGAARAVDGEEEAAGDVQVHLDQLDAEPVRRHARGPVDEQHPVGIAVELGRAGRTRACPRARARAGRAALRRRRASAAEGRSRSSQKNSSRARRASMRSRSTSVRTSIAARPYPRAAQRRRVHGTRLERARSRARARARAATSRSRPARRARAAASL